MKEHSRCSSTLILANCTHIECIARLKQWGYAYGPMIKNHSEYFSGLQLPCLIYSHSQTNAVRAEKSVETDSEQRQIYGHDIWNHAL